MQTVSVTLTGIPWMGGNIDVEGLVSSSVPGLAITPTTKWDLSKGGIRFHTWTITHIASGRALVKNMPTRIVALKELRAIATWGVDWTWTFEEFRKLPNRKDMQAKLVALREKYQDEGIFA